MLPLRLRDGEAEVVLPQISLETNLVPENENGNNQDTSAPPMVHRDHEIPPGAVAAVTTADTLVDDPAEAVQVDGEDAVYLPPYKQMTSDPGNSYNSVPILEFIKIVDSIYDEVVWWRKNLFQTPSGGSGKAFIKLLTTWLRLFNENSNLQKVAIKVFMILPVLLLQKPSVSSKVKEHINVLQQRLKHWDEGNFLEILAEGRIIQRRLKSTSKKKKIPDVSRIFSRLMFQGKIRAAMKFVESNSDSGVLPTTDEVLEALKEKHPPAAPIQQGCLLQGPLNPPQAAYFYDINEVLIHKAALQTRGAAGPSQFDADQFRRVLCSNHFKSEGKDLRDQIATFARKIASETLDPDSLDAYVACRLIPLNKNPGIRPIGIGEVLRRIVGKAVVWCLKDEIQEAAGPLQVSSGLQGGAEAAIHAMRDIFRTESTDGVVLVDASNAFNRMNRMVALHNIQFTCPPMSLILINSYRKAARLFLPGGKKYCQWKELRKAIP